MPEAFTRWVEMYKDRLEIALNEAKQELIQADSKLGWLTAIYVLIISSMISMGIYLDSGISWIIIGSISSLPITSILITLYSLSPKFIWKTNFKKSSGFNMTAIGSIAKKEYIEKMDKIDINESMISSIYVWSKISVSKYRAATVSVWITFPLLPLIKLLKYLKSGHVKSKKNE